MKRLIVLFAGFSLLVSSAARGGSIFDSTPGSDSDSTAPSRAPSRAPEPEPAPAPKPDSAPPAAVPAQNDSVSTPAPAPIADQPQADVDVLGANARAAVIAARKAVEDYRKAAEAKCLEQVEATHQYQDALTDSKLAEKNLEDARAVGDSNAKLEASAAAVRAKSKLKQICEAAMQNSDAVQESERLASSFSRQATPADKVAKSQDEEIARAIRDRRLLEGMTLQQAERAARSKPELVSQHDDMTDYRWPIMGTVRYEKHVSRDAFGHFRNSQVPVEGEVGEVRASFTGGKLVKFERVNKAGS